MNYVKVKKITKVSCKQTPVYDISVPKYNNFVLANGLVVHNCKPYQYFKSTIYDKRIEIYEDKTLIDEIINLERNMDTGKVDHPDGGKKDVADAMCGALYNASKHAEEFAYDYGESAEDLLRLNGNSNIDDVEQLTLNLEEEIKRIRHQQLLGPNTAKLDEGTEDYYLKNSDIIDIY